MTTAPYGFLRVAAACPPVTVADPRRNVDQIQRFVRKAHGLGVQRLEAHVTVEEGGETLFGALASIAVGAVRVDDGGASIIQPIEIRRTLALGNTEQVFAVAGSAAAEPIEIEKLLRRSLRLKSDCWESHFELGLALVKQRKFPEAAAELARSAALNAKEALPHYHLARVYDRLGEAEKAAAERELHAQLSAAK